MYSEIDANKRKTWVLMVFFVVLVSIVGWFVSFYFLGSPYFTVAILFGAMAYAAYSYYNAGKMAVALSKAREVDESSEQRLYRIVENLAITEGFPTPKVYVIEDPGLNAFASGKDPDHAVVAATRGLLDALDDSELQGVMAHEMGHIKNYDIRVTMMVMALVLIISLIADIAIRVAWFGGGSRRSSNSSSNGVIMIVGIIGLILAPIVAKLVQAAVSRKREYLADATGALTTRYPEGLASALEKLKVNGSTTKSQNSAMAHLYFANPLKKSSLTKYFSTHPPIDDRIARLHEMETKI